MNTPLVGPVERFVEALAPALVDLGVEPQTARQDLRVEASNLVAALIDTDGLHTDDELWAYIAAFAPGFDTSLGRATPDDIRTAGLVAGRRVWLDKPSLLLDTLLAADRRNDTAHAWTYTDVALDIAHTVASLDEHTAHAELAAIDRFRTMLVGVVGASPQLTSPPSVGTPGSGRPHEPVKGVKASEQPDVEQEPPRPLGELLAELDALIGLDAVKAEVRLVTDLLQVQRLRRERDMPVHESSHHLVFTGNPGTGKTTVARLLAQIYRTLGVVEKGHLVETDRSGLVVGYVGQTATRVVEVFDQAMEGVLLVDEAYALARGDQRDFGREAIDTMVKLLEDRRDDLVVIVAGYPAEMATFVQSNPGLRSRLPKTIHFPDYTTDELLAIVDLLAAKASYQLTPDARGALRAVLDGQERGAGFGNGRLARNLFEQAVARQASRVVALPEPTNDQLVTIEPEDIA